MPAFALALSLVCAGGGTALQPDEQLISELNNAPPQFTHNAFAPRSVARSSGVLTAYFADLVRLEVSDDRARIVMPSPVVEESGWFDLETFKVRDRSIQGTVAVSHLDRPNLYLDRQTGRMAIVGRHGTYVGTCWSQHS